ncbi:MAG: hypothetical protein IPM71_15625 [Bacteroidota bacterium]|nr:MAG: hypothetical protein IPM71_15625 [Bacteroidota bacterium]
MSAFTYSTNKLYEKVDTTISDLAVLLISGLFSIPLTHEEGHRSILTAQNIGSISKPYPNKHLAAYVIGLEDNTLINLRDNHFEEYIRLHTAGLESDYCLTKKAISILITNDVNNRGVYLDNLMRVGSDVLYLTSGLFKLKIGITEEDDELKRDIVGHDIYGMVRHLHRPDMDFYRYTEYEDLTYEEQNFVKRIGYRSFINLLSPTLIGKRFFLTKNSLKYNFSLGYSLSPFGDYIDENFWLVTQKRHLIHIYLRQYQNKSDWFPAGGVTIENMSFLNEQLLLNLSLHGWLQPENQYFISSNSSQGYGIDFLFKVPLKLKTHSNVLSIDFGCIYKTSGFLPEEVNMGEHIGFRLGTSFYLR